MVALYGPIQEAVEEIEDPVWKVLVYHDILVGICSDTFPSFVIDGVLVEPQGGMTIDIATGFPLIVVDAFYEDTNEPFPRLGYDGRILLPVPSIWNEVGEERAPEMIQNHLVSICTMLIELARSEA